MVQVCFIDGQPVPVDLTNCETLAELRWRVAQVLGAPSPSNVEFLDEAGERLEEVSFLANLGDMTIQTFLFGVDQAEADQEDCWAPPPIAEEYPGDDAAEFHDFKFSGGYAKNLDMETADLNTTRASSDQADSPAGAFPLHEAVSLGDCDAVTQLLADGYEVGKRDAGGDTALHLAAYHTRHDLVTVLLGAQADPNATDRKGKTPLRRAYDSKEVAEALISAGADPNAADKNGNTALHRAAEDDHVDVAKLLLASSAKPDVLNDDDLSALHTAAIFGKANVAMLLLGANADVNLKGSDGNTALHFAAYSGRAEVGQVLLKAGADKDARNEDGETPLEHASTGDHQAPAWLLE